MTVSTVFIVYKVKTCQNPVHFNKMTPYWLYLTKAKQDTMFLQGEDPNRSHSRCYGIISCNEILVIIVKDILPGAKAKYRQVFGTG